jgi:hypothetical protein
MTTELLDAFTNAPPNTDADRRQHQRWLEERRYALARNVRLEQYEQIVTMLRNARMAPAHDPDVEWVEPSAPDPWLDDAINVADLDGE